ncbi:MAG: YdcF family protein, partial [Myxococcota bacterium]
GKVRRLVMTGGMSEGKVSEAQVMKRYAVQEGVPSNAIVLDEKGDNTAASIRNLARLKKTQKLGALLVVSHDYHTLRLKLSCHRLGLTCYTVPAVQERRLRAEPYYVVREVAAVLYYALLFR